MTGAGAPEAGSIQTLGPRESAVWLMDPSSFDPGLAWDLLSPGEHRHALGLGHLAVRHEYLCTRALQRLSLSSHAAVAPAVWRFAPAAEGRPEIVVPAALTRLRFNLSHTAGLIACAVAWDAAIGVDVENLDSARDVDAIARRFFAPDEARVLAAHPVPERAARFIELWTLKEACLKALGTGFGTSIDAVRFAIADNGSVTGEIDEDLRRPGLDWQFLSRQLGPHHVLGLAILKPGVRDFAIRWHCWPKGSGSVWKGRGDESPVAPALQDTARGQEP